MAKKRIAVLDAGPYIHLKEIGALKALTIFELNVPLEVLDEVKSLDGISCTHPPVKNKSMIGILSTQYELGLGESAAIALCKEKNIDLLLTDDLDARTVAQKLDLQPHGTIGILLRAYREKVFTKKETMVFVRKLKTDSTIYITNNLIEYILKEIDESK
ncbi:MAG: hypothetical protein Q8P05_05350 [Candidatus Diapherotrites archaeon]|nr:hypothetical protein [Candidatus Diapherotrites archaeon]